MSVKVRFAPSPTGRLHIGNIRAALINWLFARQQGGTFVLRLDDTDTARSTDEYAEGIKTDLNWLGLNFDETFKQSERMDRYNEVADQLREKGLLYPCYESAEELDVKRKTQLSRGLPPVYDRAALKLTDEDRAKLEAEGKKPHWRFKLSTPGSVEFTDLIRGPVHIDLASVSDPILIREDGSYLYTLPSVIDDVDKGITHIVRGEDHVTNSAVQVDLFNAIGGGAPEMAHFSLMTSATGGGLSKRDGALSIKSLREDGLEAMAILSFLARAGTSDPIEPFGHTKALIEGFDFNKFSRNATKFDPNELNVLNAKILHATPYECVEGKLGIEGMTEEFWLAVRGNLEKRKDIQALWDMVHGTVEPIIADEDRNYLDEAISALPEIIDEDAWASWTTILKERTGRKGKDLFMPLRLALTGQQHGPELATLLPMMGQEKILSRLSGKAA